MSKGGKEASKGPKQGEAFIRDAEAVRLSQAPATRGPRPSLDPGWWTFLDLPVCLGPIFYSSGAHVTAPRVAPDQCGGKGHSHLCQRYLVSSSIFPLFHIHDSLNCPRSSFPGTSELGPLWQGAGQKAFRKLRPSQPAPLLHSLGCGED